jgi:hypothetical protein
LNSIQKRDKRQNEPRLLGLRFPLYGSPVKFSNQLQSRIPVNKLTYSLHSQIAPRKPIFSSPTSPPSAALLKTQEKVAYASQYHCELAIK